MRKLIVGSAVAAAAAAFMALASAPASAQSGGTPRFCYEHPDFFVIACQGMTVVYNTKTGYPAPPAPSGHHCSYESRGTVSVAIAAAPSK